MSTHKHINKICCAVLALVLAVTFWFFNAKSLGVQAVSASIGYEGRLFNTSSVHSINIVMDDWDGFLDTCENEEYAQCSVLIDNEAYKNVAIRAKGNTSLSSVSAYGNDRYSFKIEFDHYDSTKNYYGLDKLSLNNLIQDNTYLKDYLTYQMMGYFDADSPLCSFVYITVNGEDWGLYLAVEGVEDSFLERNYGNDYGELYKPDSTGMGGGRGNGGGFKMEEMDTGETTSDLDSPADSDDPNSDSNGALPDSSSTASDFTDIAPGGNMPDFNGTPPDLSGDASGTDMTNGRAGFGGDAGGMRMGSDDVSLIYSDDDYDSYTNIFDNAKTDITDADKDRLIAAIKDLGEGENIENVVNVDEVIRYFVVHNFVCNFDSYTGSMIHNYYLYEKDGILSMIPWDYNLAFGGFQSVTDAQGLVNYPIDTPVSGGTVDSRPMLAWIFNSEEYTELYHQYFEDFINSYFSSGYFEEMFDSVTEMISPYVEKDPTKFCTYEEFEKGISTLKEFCLLRAESITGQLDGSIPSTSDGQSQESAALIDASGITVSDMGSMGNMGGMGNHDGNQNQRGGADFPGAFEQNTENQPNTAEDEDVSVDKDASAATDSQSTASAAQTSSVEALSHNVKENRTDNLLPVSNEKSADTSSSGNTENTSGDSSSSDNANASDDLQSSEAGQSSETAAGNGFPGGRGQMTDFPGNMGSMENQQISDSSAPDSRTAWILVGISAAVLLAGLLFAFKFKR